MKFKSLKSNNNKIFLRVMILSLLIIFSSCGVKNVKEYYLLAYEPSIEKKDIPDKHFFPIQKKIEVETFDLNRIYDRNQIVERKSLHNMNFSTKDKWASRPQKIIAELLVTHINSYQIFSDCRREYIDFSADYYLTGRINNIEKYKNKDISFAYVNMDIYLRDKEHNIIFFHKIKKNIEMDTDNTSYFVKTLSDELKKSFNELIIRIKDYLYDKK